MDKKPTSKGRQKISIEKIKRENDCYATFSKRRLGLFKKASELSTLCDVDLGVFVFSPTGKPFSFFHPSMESVVDQFQNLGRRPDDTGRLLEACTRTRVLQTNEVLEKVGKDLEEEMERRKKLDDEVGCGWWERPVEELGKEEVEHVIGLLEDLQSQLRRYEKKNKCFET